MKQFSNSRVALVHDFLNQYGGAERVLEVFSEMFPEAPIYTIVFDPERMHGKFKNRKIITSFFRKFPRFFQRRLKYFLPLLPVAPETFDLREYDLVISSSGAWSKGIITRLNTTHIAYIHSPMRFVWDYNEKYLKEEKRRGLSFLVRPMLSYLRLWDKLAADRPDYLIANSRYTQDRIKKYYRRDSQVIYPPVNTKLQITNYPAMPDLAQPDKLQINSKTKIQNSIPNTKYQILDTKYFLIVSRLSPYKKIDKAIEAFNKLDLPLVIVGIGKQEKYLKSIAKENIKFLGWVPDEKMPEIYENARAFIFPGVDDFGITLAEAMAYGTPVLAGKYGGAIEIVEAGKTGEFFEKPVPEAIADAVRKFIKKEKNYDREYIRQSVEKFGKERFKREMGEIIKKATEN